MSRIIIIEELLLVNENANELILKQKMAQFLNFSISVDIKSRYFLLYVINDVVSQNTTNVILFCGNTHQPLSITTPAPAILCYFKPFNTKVFSFIIINSALLIIQKATSVNYC